MKRIDTRHTIENKHKTHKNTPLRINTRHMKTHNEENKAARFLGCFPPTSQQRPAVLQLRLQPAPSIFSPVQGLNHLTVRTGNQSQLHLVISEDYV